MTCDFDSKNTFIKSDVGAQSAWKGFSSQTVYIAYRIASDINDYDFFPEDIEDLVVKKDGIVIEAIQVKNISHDLTLSSLASTKSSKNGEGFFKRVCNLHASYSSFSKVKIIYFNSLGEEITEFLKGNEDSKKYILKKLTDNHNVPEDCADWLLSSLDFEKVNIDQLQVVINDQLKECVPIMAAPDLAQSLLIQYVSDLSRTKGSTNLKQWRESIHKIGTDIAAMDGYYKEYQKSLLRLCDLTLDKDIEQLKKEFEQGVSVHPDYIRNNFDFYRKNWLDKIDKKIEKGNAVIVNGVSGQGKSALCYRFLIDHYPEKLVFCVRRVESSRQAENLAIALKGIAKHTKNIIVYIDVNPGEHQWILLVQELQMRGVPVPVLVSIREEDFKMTRIDSSSINLELIELSFSKEEAEIIYKGFTDAFPHPQLRSFDEAWIRFGGDGPFIEFVYLLTNSQTLKQRLIAQIDNLLRESRPDSWFMLLQLVCFAGKTGCPLTFDNIKQEVPCNNIFAAIQRLSNEYLIRKSEDGAYIEALHPLRAQIICDILAEKIGEDSDTLMLSALKCIDSNFVQLFLMNYFSNHNYSPEIIAKIANIGSQDWITCAGFVKSMLWLDVKRYIQLNHEVINDLINRYGSGWLPYLPLDISGLVRPDEFILESFIESLEILNKNEIKADVNRIRNSLTSLHIDYAITDLFIKNCTPPSNIPQKDNEWSAFGYSLFWFAKRKRRLEIHFSVDQVTKKMSLGDIKSRADAILGIYEQNYQEYYNASAVALSERMIQEYCVLHFSVTDTEVQCRFVPQIFKTPTNEDERKNFNNYWRMKLVNILDQIYPDKEYIDVALVGVDLFKDLGIEALDYKAHIPKSYRYKSWIVEINSWVKPRIDYSYRPDSWEEYVSQIDQVRSAANTLISDMILYIDHLYKKQYGNPELQSRLLKGICYLKKLLLYELLLPKTAVDSYCLYSEHMKNSDQNTGYTSSQKLGSSIDLYSDFSKSFSNTFRDLLLFFDQFDQVLSARKNRQTLDDIKNSFLSQYNLFHSAIALDTMQKEYNKLFFKYKNLNNDFEDRETQGMLTLVNVWAHVIENHIRGISIAYDAKLLFKKSQAIIDRAFKDACDLLSGKTHIVDGKTYILANFNPYSGNTVRNEYERVVLILRKVLSKAHSYNSVRWYLETQSPELIYVPILENVPLPTGFQIPVYRILDVCESQLSTVLFPAELPLPLYSILGINCEELNQWKLAAGYFGAIKMQIAQYNDVINKLSLSTAICESGVAQYIHVFTDQLLEMITKLLDIIRLPLKTLDLVLNEDIEKALVIIQNTLDDIQIVHEQIENLQKVEDIEQKIDNTVSCMLLLQPYVLAGTHILHSPTE